MLRHSRQLVGRQPSRRGSTALMAVIALVVMMLCVALVLDRLWMEAVMVELTTGAEAAALAAGREYVSDDMLKTNQDTVETTERARRKAMEIASQNMVAGTPLELKGDAENGDIRFGRRIWDDESSQLMFIETDYTPTSVRVHAERSRSRWNPIALFMHGISSTQYADAVEQAEATWDNQLVALRPYEGVPVPAFPMAILKKDRNGRRKDTWQSQIDEHRGKDEYGFDAETNQVTQEPDGIREIVLKSMKPKGKASDSNVLVVGIGTDLEQSAVEAQFRIGWNVDDLSSLQGKMEFGAKSPTLNAVAVIDDSVAGVLKEMLGKPRIVLLYENQKVKGKSGACTATAVEAVAGRVLAVRQVDGGCEIVFQPSVVTTRTALVKSETVAREVVESDELDSPSDSAEATDAETIPPNRYIYKLQLTH